MAKKIAITNTQAILDINQRLDVLEKLIKETEKPAAEVREVDTDEAVIAYTSTNETLLTLASNEALMILTYFAKPKSDEDFDLDDVGIPENLMELLDMYEGWRGNRDISQYERSSTNNKNRVMVITQYMNYSVE